MAKKTFYINLKDQKFNFTKVINKEINFKSFIKLTDNGRIKTVDNNSCISNIYSNKNVGYSIKINKLLLKNRFNKDLRLDSPIRAKKLYKHIPFKHRDSMRLLFKNNKQKLDGEHEIKCFQFSLRNIMRKILLWIVKNLFLLKNQNTRIFFLQDFNKLIFSISHTLSKKTPLISFVFQYTINILGGLFLTNTFFKSKSFFSYSLLSFLLIDIFKQIQNLHLKVSFELLLERFEKKTFLKKPTILIESNKGGYILLCFGFRGFLPLTQARYGWKREFSENMREKWGRHIHYLIKLSYIFPLRLPIAIVKDITVYPPKDILKLVRNKRRRKIWIPSINIIFLQTNKRLFSKKKKYKKYKKGLKTV